MSRVSVSSSIENQQAVPAPANASRVRGRRVRGEGSVEGLGGEGVSYLFGGGPDREARGAVGRG